MTARLDNLDALARRHILRALAAISAVPDFSFVRLVDCTAGNGNDTLFLAEHAGPNGRVLALDIQPEALRNTQARLAKAGLDSRVRLLQAGHEQLAALLPAEWDGQADIAMYNLGFLPGQESLNGVITRPATTLASLEAAALLLAPNGLLSVHTYAGHPGGQEESALVLAWFSLLPWAEWQVARYDFPNKPHNPESLFLAQRR